MAQVEYNLVDDVLRFAPEFYRVFRRVPFALTDIDAPSIPYNEVPEATERKLHEPDSVVGPLGTTMLFPITIDGWRIPGPTLINLTGRMSVIYTPMHGGRGTTKEITNEGEHRFVIRGFLLSEAHLAGRAGGGEVVTGGYPTAELEQLIRIIKKGASVKVECEYLGYFGITEMLIENHSFPQAEGMDDMIPFELSCVEDEPFDILFNPKVSTQ